LLLVTCACWPVIKPANDPLLIAKMEPMDSTLGLERFVTAQEPVYAQVCSELRAGRKTSHWMWYIFPQISGLGFSSMSQMYAIRNRAEAEAYLAHPVLGVRLRECTNLLNAVEGRSAHEIFGSPDDVKFRSCMTLFAACAAEPQPFQQALDKYYAGRPDPKTLALLGPGDSRS
jgi:uncharacterized protein (DUF1810 family)